MDLKGDFRLLLKSLIIIFLLTSNIIVFAYLGISPTPDEFILAIFLIILFALMVVAIVIDLIPDNYVTRGILMCLAIPAIIFILLLLVLGLQVRVFTLVVATAIYTLALEAWRFSLNAGRG